MAHLPVLSAREIVQAFQSRRGRVRGFTALRFVHHDLHQAGFRVLMIEDACAGIDLPVAGLYQVKTCKERLGLRSSIGRLFETRPRRTSQRDSPRLSPTRFRVGPRSLDCLEPP